MGDYTEGVMVTFDKNQISFAAVARHFFASHSPYSNCPPSSKRQYLKGVWWHSQHQKDVVVAAVTEIQNKHGEKPLTTHLSPVGKVYRAEEYHQRYYQKFKKSISTKGLRLLAKNHRQQKTEAPTPKEIQQSGEAKK